jgi:hypothetical protein
MTTSQTEADRMSRRCVAHQHRTSDRARAQQLPREEWGAVPISVSHSGTNWVIAGKTNRVTLNETSLALTIQSGPVHWKMMPSQPGDMLVRSKDTPLSLRLADAKTILIVPYDAAFKTGVKISLSGWQHDGRQLDLELFLTICLEGRTKKLCSMSQRTSKTQPCSNWTGPAL